jgi:uncharacterized protein (TIGR03118 family)
MHTGRVHFSSRFRYGLLAGAFTFLAVLPGCDDSDDSGTSPSPSNDTSFQDIVLVTDSAGLLIPRDSAGNIDTSKIDTTGNHARLDSNLVNPWGMVMKDGQHFWVANNGTGTSTIYSGTGESTGAAVTVPGANGTAKGAPTGMVLNTTAGFKVPGSTTPATVLFANEDGSVAAWSTGSKAKIAFKHGGDSAVYKGIAIATDSGKPFLYLANFKGKKVEVLDSAFKIDTTKHFADSTIPSDFGPFNVALVDTFLYVSYAKLGSGGEDDVKGSGNGYINVFTTKGKKVKRFVSQGSLNSPWGMTKLTSTFGPFVANTIMVGNFGSGNILAYDTSGALKGTVADSSGSPIEIDGLWSILFVPSGTVSGVSGNALYYTAGPDDESHGIFGYLIHP